MNDVYGFELFPLYLLLGIMHVIGMFCWTLISSSSTSSPVSLSLIWHESGLILPVQHLARW